MRVKYIIIASEKAKNTAAINRIELITKGLNELGIHTSIYKLYSYFFNLKRGFKIGFIICIIKMILVLVLSSKKDIFIIYGEFPYLFLFKYLKKNGQSIIIERNEYSTYLISQKKISKKELHLINLYERNIKLANKFITCSTYLKNYYSGFVNSNCRFQILPLITDISSYNIKKKNTEKKYIAYCGDFGNNKDGVPDLINAFSIISLKHDDIYLHLIGDNSDKCTMKSLYDLVNKLNLKERIVFTGKVNHCEIPSLLNNAYILALARPNNKQAEGGIPSKVAEYLSTGNPTLITRVGELDKYFTDKENIFFSHPDSVEEFAYNLEYIIQNYEQAIKIGKEGKNIISQFDYKIQTLQLSKFIADI